MVEKIFIREYLESLKEDSELDLIFTLLMDAMDFRVVKTPRESKGQSQFGKDTIAIGLDGEGKKTRWYFELKGYDDRDIEQRTFIKDDGIKESLIESKYSQFTAAGIPEFDSLPRKIVLVHNGITKENFRPTFEGFIAKEFEPNEFEDWDINRLTDLFSQHLFNEYLLSDPIGVRLFKRVLVFLEVPEYNLADLNQLMSHIFVSYEKSISSSNKSSLKRSKRQREKMLATINLISIIIFHYSKENDNLIPAKNCLALIVVRTWHFILTKKAEKNKKYLRYFDNLLWTQMDVLEAYFGKTIQYACKPHGLFSSEGFAFEPIGYPLRCFEYLDDIVYFFSLQCAFISDPEEIKRIRHEQKNILFQLVSNNSGMIRPILDQHSIPILHFILFVLNYDLTQEEGQFICEFIRDCVESIIIRKRTNNTFPMLGHDLEKLVEFEITHKKPYGYIDSSSLLIPILIELTALFKLELIYSVCRENFFKEPDLQTAFPEYTIENEELFFIKNMDEAYSIENFVELPKTVEEMRQNIVLSISEVPPNRTSKAGYGFLIMLAQSMLGNEPHPNEWRRLFLRFK